MRQRKAKDLEKRLQECSVYMIELSPKGEAETGHWFPGRSGADLYFEIGCGKGDFILQKAEADPESNFVGIEGQETVILRAMEKAMKADEEGQASLCNLKFACRFVHSVTELVGENSLAGIYLNFSDPWPKARHAKRRLTWRGRLMDYAKAIRPGGFLEFKTDNDDLFEFTMEEIQACGLRVSQVSRDLHASDLEARLTMTEYEKKFHAAGKNINFVRVEF